MNFITCSSKIATLTYILSSTLAFASNPIVKHIYTADPAAAVFDDTVYIYTGHDEADIDESAYVMDDWHVFSSQDLVNWTDHGEALSLDEFSWASSDAWAGQVIKRGDKYYWYVPVNNDDDGWFGIGVAVSDSPTGPFHDAIGQALVTDSMTPNETLDIDPTVFIDKDGQAYLYWGNATDDGIIKMAKLKSNMIELDGDIESIDTDQVPSFTEAPYLHERNGIYYLSYAASWPERIDYATADNPMGPFTYQGTILDADDVSSPTSHQSIIQYHDQWYLVYHNADLPDGGEYRRSVAMDKLYYDDEGNIEKVTPTTEGVGTAGLSGEYLIKNEQTNLCLQPLHSNGYDGSALVQKPCDDSLTQRFIFHHTLDDKYQIEHETTHKVLDMGDGASNNGMGAVLWSNHDSLNQYWNLKSLSEDESVYAINNAQTGQTLVSLPVKSQKHQTQGHSQQQWRIVRADTVQIEPLNYPDTVLSYRANGVWLESSPEPVTSSEFHAVPGLADGSGVSFASVKFPGYYLRHRNFALYLEYDNGSDTFTEDATFYRRKGLADDSDVSYESYNYPGYYIRHQYYQLKLDSESDISDNSDATFIEVKE
ncbi:family 43 glycosylhydrolase [Vibrio sp. CAIM 722]|uniref:Family 43 glycosylhydrolase n=1 Tax=Vibrio eleionomae TaxID=2653505 RepID=A0A7X4LMB0_9VIBR|nr:family 43 glycosylhydrolase [Vibrio eleionomae]MZI94519.1 family 43 glycosylhydrolase [Vibrio eleionomae]